MNIEYITEKVDAIEAGLASVDKSLAVYNEQLKIHMNRTDLLEKKVEILVERDLKLTGFVLYGGWILGVAISLIEIIKLII